MFNLLWYAAILLCTGLCLFALIFTSVVKGSGGGRTRTQPDSQAVSLETVDTPVEETPAPTEEPINDVVLGETPDAGHGYLDAIIFLGDSTSYGMGYYQKHGYPDLVPSSQIWADSNGTLNLAYQSTSLIHYPDTDEDLLIGQAARLKQPEYLIITLGVNGIAMLDQDAFIHQYTDLVQRIQAASPNTKIVCNSIFPVAANYGTLSQINNEKIQAANSWIVTVVEATGTHFLNSFSALVGPDGWLPQELQNGDGLHLTGEAFEIFLEYVRTHKCP